MRSLNPPIVWPWLTEAIILGLLIIVSAITILLMLAIVLESCINHADARREHHQKGGQS